MKILFYSPVQLKAGGGCERWHCDVTASLEDQFNHDVKIVTANLGKDQWSQDYLDSQLKVEYKKINFPILSGALLPTPGAILSLYKYFKWADKVHIIQGFIGQDIVILFLKLITGKKVYVGHHAPIFHKVILHNLYIKYVSRFLFNFFDGHMTLNSSDKKYLEENWKIKNVQFIPSGIKVNRFLAAKRKLHNNLNFITVGIYRPQKGIDLLLNAIEKFNAHFPDNKAIFRFVGGGEQAELISQYSRRNKNIIDMGYVKYDDMPDLYDKSDVYLLSSREEPFGLVLIEGWASGIPALATKTEGPLDMLNEGKNGWFINTIDSDGMYNSLSEIYNKWSSSNLVLKKMEEDCRTTGREYSIDKTAQNMNNYLFNSK
jgi:glycosyltransferase involved in cell wall biosynthesis